jgi:hypothetical protein
VAYFEGPDGAPYPYDHDYYQGAGGSAATDPKIAATARRLTAPSAARLSVDLAVALEQGCERRLGRTKNGRRLLWSQLL